MKKTALILGMSALLATSASFADGHKNDQMVNESRAAIKQFGGQLKGELQKAMKAGGPVNAIQVCNEVAPGIAAKISEEKGWDVARTSLKTRNAGNAPDAWETKVLTSFDERKAAGEDPMKIDYSEITEVDGKKAFRYMKAIPTAKVCLNCHAAEIDAKVEAKINELYPEDKARGYKEGDIRGAFTIIRPM
ncbi:MAG: DUF3365 domain-containing protein [Gammaproteobacteria bacterium]|nr:DUF3365 domain-containing protein [Gammaproteobacteria bacterium]